MPTMTQGQLAGEHLISEANGSRSREKETLVAGNNVAAGTVLGRITASSKLTEYSAGAADGSEVAVRILYASVDASAADVEVVTHARDTEVDESALTGLDAAAKTALESQGIVFRS